MALAKIMHALQEIGNAVTNNDEQAFRAAVQYGEQIGCSPEQIRDAYDYRRRIHHGLVCFPFTRA